MENPKQKNEHMYVYKSVICHNIYVQRMVRVILKTKQWFNKMSTIFTTQSQASRQLILHAYSTDTVHVSKGLNVSFGCLLHYNLPKWQCVISQLPR